MLTHSCLQEDDYSTDWWVGRSRNTGLDPFSPCGSPVWPLETSGLFQPQERLFLVENFSGCLGSISSCTHYIILSPSPLNACRIKIQTPLVYPVHLTFPFIPVPSLQPRNVSRYVSYFKNISVENDIKNLLIRCWLLFVYDFYLFLACNLALIVSTFS